MTGRRLAAAPHLSKAMLKMLLSVPMFQSLVGRSIGVYMLVARYLIRWTYVDRRHGETLWRTGEPVVMCFWHGRAMMAFMGWPIGKKGAQPLKMLSSNSRDGQWMSRAVLMVGAKLVRGSSAKGGNTKGSIQATREMLRHLKSGGCMSLTADGSRGPRMRAQLGAIQLARLSGAPILPISWATEGFTRVKSWDRATVPHLFTRGVFVWGQPVSVARNASEAEIEACRQRLEAELNRITREADLAVAAEPVIPADPAPASADA